MISDAIDELEDDMENAGDALSAVERKQERDRATVNEVRDGNVVTHVVSPYHRKM